MDDAEVFHVSKSWKQLNGKSSDQAILETLVIIHLDEFIQVNAKQLKDTAKMISEHEVISQFDNSFNIVRVTLL